MDSDDEPTCGQGLAANADLPAKLAALLAAQAEVLERHTRALDPADPASRPELDAYTQLVSRQREIAAALDGLAQQMASYRALPMAEHDLAVMLDPKGQLEAFQHFVAIERELLALLQTKLAGDEQLLA